MFVLVAAWILLKASEPEPAVSTSREEAEALLSEAVRLVQDDNYGGLCETLAARSNCNIHLQEARVAGLTPSKTEPEVVEAIQLGTDGISLRLQGTYADGRTYETEFRVFRSDGQLQIANPVYWLPIQYVEGECKQESGHSECGATVSPPVQ